MLLGGVCLHPAGYIHSASMVDGRRAACLGKSKGALVRYHLYIDDGGNGHLIPEEGRYHRKPDVPRAGGPRRSSVEAAANTPGDQMQLALQSALAEWHRNRGSPKAPVRSAHACAPATEYGHREAP